MDHRENPVIYLSAVNKVKMQEMVMCVVVSKFRIINTLIRFYNIPCFTTGQTRGQDILWESLNSILYTFG